MSCLEGSGGQPVRCRFCTQPWDGSSLVLGTMYSYDIFAAMPCCSERLKVSPEFVTRRPNRTFDLSNTRVLIHHRGWYALVFEYKQFFNVIMSRAFVHSRAFGTLIIPRLFRTYVNFSQFDIDVNCDSIMSILTSSCNFYFFIFYKLTVSRTVIERDLRSLRMFRACNTKLQYVTN